MFDVPALDDPRILVPISVPVKGRKTRLVLRLPRFDFIDEHQHDALQAAVDGVDESLPPRKRQWAANLLMIKPFVSAADYKACETLSSGQVNMIVSYWAQQSTISVGEFLASADSSTESTEAQSDSTSTTEDGPAATSAAG